MAQADDKKGEQRHEKEESKPKKICCACPETKVRLRRPRKAMRDQCIAEKGEDACQDLIEKHKECLRAEGFNV